MADKTENPSFAEIKERFKKMNVLPYPRPITPTTDNESAPASNPPVSERVKVEPSHQSSGKDLFIHVDIKISTDYPTST
jgi:hypothetical protein